MEAGIGYGAAITVAIQMQSAGSGNAAYAKIQPSAARSTITF